MDIEAGADLDVRRAALVVTPHPLTLQGQRVMDARAAALVPGERLDAFLARHGVLPGQQWAVAIGGAEVPEAMWHRVRPKDGHLVECRRTARKEVLKLVAMAALTYATFGLGGAGGFMMSSYGALAAGATYIAGSMLINKLLGPKPLSSQANTVSPTYSLNGGRNRARLWEPMGLVLGEPYCVPDLAAQPYTYFDSGEMYLWQLLHAGINCAEVNTIRIGQTAIANYQNVTISQVGMVSGNTGLPALAQSVDTIAGALLDAPAAPGAWVVRTSSLNTLILAIDLECSLYSVDGSGRYAAQSVSVDAEYRLVGSGPWLPFVDGGATQSLTNASTKPLRGTVTRTVDVPGQYEVRLRKNDANLTDTSAQNVVQWTSLKSYQDGSGDYTGQSAVGIQIQASGQLNGALDEVNWRARAKPMPVWNGSAYVTATDRASGLCNPGAILQLLAYGVRDEGGRVLAGCGFELDQIDLESLRGFTLWCAAKGFTFDYFVQETVSAQDLLDAVAAAGLGAISWHTGKLGVIWFADDQPVEAVLNMATIKAKSFSVTYDTGTTADELEAQYFDRDRGDTWQSVRVLAPGVSTPTQTARVQLTGVTTEAQAAVLARWAMAQNIYQRKTVAAEVDLEHLTMHRGTVIALSHDVTQWGYGGRVLAAVNVAGVVTLTLDDVVPAGTGSRYLGVRVPGERQYRVLPVTSLAGGGRQVVVNWPGGVPVPGDSAGNPAWDTVWIYDFKATPGQKLRVADISPVGNLDGARLALVPESAEMWTYIWTGAYSPPPTDSLLAQGAPVLSGVTISEQRVLVGAAYMVDVTLSFSIAGAYERTELFGSLDGAAAQQLGSTNSLAVTFRAEPGQAWALALRPYSSLHAGAVVAVAHTVGAAGPAVFDTFSVSTRTDGTRVFDWGYTITPAPANLLGAVIRWVAGTVPSPDWASMNALHSGALPSSPIETTGIPAGTYTLACRAMDTDGLLSSGMRVVTITLPAMGSAPPLLTISANGTTLSYTSAGAAYPAATTITMDAVLQNITGTVTWTATAYDAVGTNLGSVTLGVAGNTATLSSAQFLANSATQFVIVSAALAGATTALHRVTKITDGAEAILTVFVPTDATLPADASGNVTSWANASAQAYVVQGATVFSSGITYGLAPGGNPDLLSFSVTSGGLLTVTGAGSWAAASNATSITIRMTHTASGFYRDVPFRLTKARTGATGPSGVDGISWELGNAAHTVPASSAGVVSDYTGSGTTIRILEGSSYLTYHATTLANSRFTIGTPVVSPAGKITAGAISGSTTTTATVAQHSAMDSATDVVTITYPVTVRRANGSDVAFNLVQTITKARAGATGGTGATGTRGSLNFASTSAAYTASYNNGAGAGAPSYRAQATSLIATAAAGTTPTTPIKGDTITFKNDAGYSTVYQNDGTYSTNGNNSWVVLTWVIDGSLVVTASLDVSTLKAGTRSGANGSFSLDTNAGYGAGVLTVTRGVSNVSALATYWDSYTGGSGNGAALQVGSERGISLAVYAPNGNNKDRPVQFLDSNYATRTNDFVYILGKLTVANGDFTYDGIKFDRPSAYDGNYYMAPDGKYRYLAAGFGSTTVTQTLSNFPGTYTGNNIWIQWDIRDPISGNNKRYGVPAWPLTP